MKVAAALPSRYLAGLWRRHHNMPPPFLGYAAVDLLLLFLAPRRQCATPAARNEATLGLKAMSYDYAIAMMPTAK